MDDPPRGAGAERVDVRAGWHARNAAELEGILRLELPVGAEADAQRILFLGSQSGS